MLSIYGSIELSDKFNLDNGVYKEFAETREFISSPVIIMGHEIARHNYPWPITTGLV